LTNKKCRVILTNEDWKIEESDEIAEGIVVDYDEKSKPLGIEFLDAAAL